MADVRSLLHSERASRRIVHPYSSYSATGILICLVCNVQVKSESLWDNHLRSEQHAMRLRRDDANSLPKPSTAVISDKRKRKSDGNESDDSRKRMKNEKNRAKAMTGFLPEGFFDEPTESGAVSAEDQLEEDNLDQAQLDSMPVRSKGPATSSSTLPQDFFDVSPAAPQDIDEDEWAAFERDIAAETAPAPPPLSALTAAATISAPALSASEIATRSADEANMQRKEQKEAEVEAEKEDAARQLEEEFDEMESLEERVRRLREKREELRHARTASSAAPAEVDTGPDRGTVQGARTRMERDSGEGEDEVDDDDDDDDDGDWDEWRLRSA